MAIASSHAMAQGTLPSNPPVGYIKLFFDGSGVLQSLNSSGVLAPIGGVASGDMSKAVYDPQNIGSDTFDRSNHTGTQSATTILQDATHRMVSDSQVSSWDNKEPAFAKSTAHNKDFAGSGTASTVAHSDHDHDSQYQVKSIPAEDTQIRIYNTDGSTTFQAAPDIAALHPPIIHYIDQKSTGVHGGTFTSGARRTRELNTILWDEIPGASLSNNQITLPAGEYDIIASVPCCGVAEVRSWLYNVTTAQDVVTSASYITVSNFIQTVDCILQCHFTLVIESILEVQHRCAVSQNTYGLGHASNFDNEIYTNLVIHKLA